MRKMMRVSEISYDSVVELLCFLVIVAAIFFHLQSSFAHWRIRDVLGPSPVPIFGNFKETILAGCSITEFLRKVYGKYCKERMVGLFTGGESILLLKDIDLIKDVLVKDFLSFTDHGIRTGQKIEQLSGNLLMVNPERWREVRSKLSNVLSSEILKNMVQVLEEHTESFAKYLEKVAIDGGLIKCNKLVSRYVAGSVGSWTFGLDTKEFEERGEEFVRNAEELMKETFVTSLLGKLKFLAPWLHDLFTYYLPLHKSNKYFRDLILSSIKQRKRMRIDRRDLIDLMVELQQRPEKISELELTEEQLVDQAMMFFVSGYQASSVTMSYALYELAKDQRMQEKVREEVRLEMDKNGGILDRESLGKMVYLDLIFKETLRKYPAVVYLVRRSRRNYRFTGTKVVVPKGQLIWIPVQAIHQDPAVYPQPEAFDPERFRAGNFESAHPISYLAFGDGSRNCIGSQFATLQTKLGLAKILQSYTVNLFGEHKALQYGDEGGQFASIPKDIILKINKLQ